MALFDHFHNIYDVAFKPRLLRVLLKDHVPDQSQPFRSPSELSIVLSAIKTHQLLSEFVTESIDQKHIDKWKSAVDSWVDRLLVLLSCNMPDKCWAGTCLLGLACQECSSDCFLASYSVWFLNLLSHIQLAAESHFVKVACCTSISDNRFINKEGAIHLLCTCITFYPSSVQHHYDTSTATTCCRYRAARDRVFQDVCIARTKDKGLFSQRFC